MMHLYLQCINILTLTNAIRSLNNVNIRGLHRKIFKSQTSIVAQNWSKRLSSLYYILYPFLIIWWLGIFFRRPDKLPLSPSIQLIFLHQYSRTVKYYIFSSIPFSLIDTAYTIHSTNYCSLDNLKGSQDFQNHAIVPLNTSDIYSCSPTLNQNSL